MAPGLPYAIAAKLAFPERQSIAFIGDGGFSMLMAEFLTAVKYQLPIVVVIIKNNMLGQIKWEQIVFLGNPQYGVELHNPDFARYAEICGGVGGNSVASQINPARLLRHHIVRPTPALQSNNTRTQVLAV